jgi:hypothetical protein
VHSDVPLACRVPTGPLPHQINSGPEPEGGRDESSENKDEFAIDQGDGPPYTPLTIALQGTLQRSHLHIWTDMNVLIHKLSSTTSPKRMKARTAPGYIVAGTAYSLPELDVTVQGKVEQEKPMSREEKHAVLLMNAKNPWTPGHGSKVVRSEPLTFKFHINWVEGGESLGWIESPSSKGPSTPGGFVAKLLLFVMAAAIGALAATFWHRHNGGRRHKSEGILGRTTDTSGATYGDGGRMNGYGRYVQGKGVGGYGYRRYSSSKKS